MSLSSTLWLGYVPGDTAPQYDARLDRQVLDALVYSEGVARVNDLKVTPRAEGANFSVDIGSGKAWITGDATTAQGKYLQENVGKENVGNSTTFAPPGSGSRVYEVWLQVNDKQSGGSTSYDPQWVIRIADVTPLTTAILLARVTVVQGQSSIQAQHISDVRPFAKPMGYNSIQQYLTFSGKTDGSGFLNLPHTLGRKPAGCVVTSADPVPNTGTQATSVTYSLTASTADHVRSRVWRATAYYVHPNENVTISYIVW